MHDYKAICPFTLAYPLLAFRGRISIFAIFPHEFYGSVFRSDRRSLYRKQTERSVIVIVPLPINFWVWSFGNGDRELIEKGYDERLQKHYYKIYFDAETYMSAYEKK
jgi:hypothetical protein